MKFKRGDKVYFRRSPSRFIGIVEEVTEQGITVTHIEHGCQQRKVETSTLPPDESVQLMTEAAWLELTADEPAFAGSISRERFINLKREHDQLDGVTRAQDRCQERIDLIEMLMDASPWLVHPEYGCIGKHEAALIDALETVTCQLRGHPEVGSGNSKVHYCYHKALGALKDATDRRMMP